MAKIKLGSNLADIRGKLNGHVFSKNRNGNYVKTKTNPINRHSTAQSAVRAFFSTLTKGWRSLTAAQRASFNTAVENFRKQNSLAESIVLTGHQLYIALNRNLQTIGSAVITAAPAVTTIAPITSASVVADVSDATQVLTYAPAIPAGQKMIVEATRPLSAGKNSNSQDYKKIGVYVTADASPLDITSAYEAVFGTGWKVAGQKVFYRIKEVGTTSGISTVPSYINTIVQA